MYLSSIRLACNAIGFAAWFVLFIQLAGNGHLTVDPKWDVYLANVLALLIPLGLLIIDFRTRKSGPLAQSLSSIAWMILWTFTGIIGVLVTGWSAHMGEWESGRWYGYVAPLLVATNTLAALLLLGRALWPTHKETY